MKNEAFFKMKNRIKSIRKGIEEKIEIEFAILFLFLHICFMFLFFAAGVKVMFWINVGSVLCYLLEIFLARKKKFVLFYNILTFEILVHIIASEMTVGLSCCFSLYCYCVLTYLYFQIFVKKLSKISIKNTVFWIVIYSILPIGIVLWNQLVGPIYTNHNKQFIFAIINVCMVIIFINFFLGIAGEVIKKFEYALLEQNKLFEKLSYVDVLTGLWNRRKLYEDFNTCTDNKDAFSIILGDIDDFKKVNDTYGHECGDMVLVETSKLIKDEIGEAGYVYRWGGEEILMFLPQCTKQEAQLKANQILEKLKANEMTYEEKKVSVTMTMGVAEGHGKNVLDLIIRKADDHLYVGKANGKAQVCS